MARVRNASKKREAILEKFRSTDSHPSAEWIYQELKSDYPDLSLGTVYRNIALFKEGGELISVGTVQGQERFDAKTHPHAHFVCNECGAVIDLDTQINQQEMYSHVSEKYGCTVEFHDLTFKGVCKNCLKAKK